MSWSLGCDLLFWRGSTVVHHGGAGATTAAARAGTRQVVVARMVDQSYGVGRATAAAKLLLDALTADEGRAAPAPAGSRAPTDRV